MPLFTTQSLRQTLLLCLTACTMLLAGCGGTNFGPMGSISGKLTMDGKPLTEGTMLLFMQMEAGYACYGKTDLEGNYTIQWRREGEQKSEVPIGEYKVLIQPPAYEREVEELSAEEMLDGVDEDIKPAQPMFPKKYQQHATSGLQYPVKEGPNLINIDLTSS